MGRQLVAAGRVNASASESGRRPPPRWLVAHGRFPDPPPRSPLRPDVRATESSGAGLLDQGAHVRCAPPAHGGDGASPGTEPVCETPETTVGIATVRRRSGAPEPGEDGGRSMRKLEDPGRAHAVGRGFLSPQTAPQASPAAPSGPDQASSRHGGGRLRGPASIGPRPEGRASGEAAGSHAWLTGKRPPEEGPGRTRRASPGRADADADAGVQGDERMRMPVRHATVRTKGARAKGRRWPSAERGRTVGGVRPPASAGRRAQPAPRASRAGPGSVGR